MGSYLVTKQHIDTLVGAAIEIAHEKNERFAYDATPHLRITVMPAEADRIGQRLWATNLDAYMEYYHQTGYPDVRAEVESYRYHEPRSLVDASVGSLLKALDSYAFQTSGASYWERSEAKGFCDSLRQALIEQLDEYRDAPWVIEEYVEEIRSLPDLGVRLVFPTPEVPHA